GISSGRNSISATTITLRGNMGYNNGSPTEEKRPQVERQTEAWVISSKFSASEVDLGADKATVVKKFGDPSISSYTYTYDKPGEYDAVFMFSNVNEKNENKVVYKTVHVSIPESPETTD
ncbi:MAG: hypothetical protein PUB45_01470, partial [Bacteroidales bacterium]|nr:hypothetical protein [Bacteroidales bacterium]